MEAELGVATPVISAPGKLRPEDCLDFLDHPELNSETVSKIKPPNNQKDGFLKL